MFAFRSRNFPLYAVRDSNRVYLLRDLMFSLAQIKVNRQLCFHEQLKKPEVLKKSNSFSFGTRCHW